MDCLKLLDGPDDNWHITDHLMPTKSGALLSNQRKPTTRRHVLAAINSVRTTKDPAPESRRSIFRQLSREGKARVRLGQSIRQVSAPRLSNAVAFVRVKCVSRRSPLAGSRSGDVYRLKSSPAAFIGRVTAKDKTAANFIGAPEVIRAPDLYLCRAPTAIRGRSCRQCAASA